MAFDPTRLNVALDTIGGGALRIHHLEAGADSLATILGAGYITGARRLGIRVSDIVVITTADNENKLATVASIASDAATLLLDDIANETVNGETLEDWLTYAGQAEAEGGTATAGLMNPLRTKQAVAAQVAVRGKASGAEVQTGTDDTKAVTPLAVAEAIASQAEAEAGVISGALMNPLRTKQAIAALAVDLTKASQAEAEAGTVDTKSMTPLRTRQAIAASPLATLSTPGLIPHTDMMKLAGIVPLDIFDTGSADTYTWVQDAIDTATAEGATLILPHGDPVLVDGTLVLPSNFSLRNEGRRILRKTFGGYAPFITSTDYATQHYISNVQMDGLMLDDLDKERHGHFLLVACDDLTMLRFRARKKSAHWTTCINGERQRWESPDVYCYEAELFTGAEEWRQPWCDGLHFGLVRDIVITNPTVTAQDDAIAFTIDPAAQDHMKPRAGESEIRPIGRCSVDGGRLQSKQGNWIAIAAGTADAPGHVAHKGMRFMNFTGVVDDAAGQARGGLGCEDQRTTATAKFDDIVYSNLTVEGNSTTQSIGGIVGYHPGREAFNGFGRVVYHNISHRDRDVSGAGLGYFRGVDDLRFSRINTRPGATLGAPGVVGVYAENCKEVRFEDCDIRANVEANVVTLVGYTRAVFRNTEIGGPAGSSSAYAALALVPASGARLDVHGLQLWNAQRSVTQEGTHATRSVRGVDQVNILNPSLPADFVDGTTP